jgi:hypothetical protein
MIVITRISERAGAAETKILRGESNVAGLDFLLPSLSASSDLAGSSVNLQLGFLNLCGCCIGSRFAYNPADIISLLMEKGQTERASNL